MAVPYSTTYHLNSFQSFGLQIKGASGLSVYGIDLKRLLNITFASEFVARVVDIPNENELVFVNDKDALEFWNIERRERTQNIECRPNVFTYIKIKHGYLFLLNNREEFILQTVAELETIQRR